RPRENRGGSRCPAASVPRTTPRRGCGGPAAHPVGLVTIAENPDGAWQCSRMVAHAPRYCRCFQSARRRDTRRAKTPPQAPKYPTTCPPSAPSGSYAGGARMPLRNPSQATQRWHCLVLFYARQYEEAIGAYQHSLALDPDDPNASPWLVLPTTLSAGSR